MMELHNCIAMTTLGSIKSYLDDHIKKVDESLSYVDRDERIECEALRELSDKFFKEEKK